mgnify:CR=1 FL=1
MSAVLTVAFGWAALIGGVALLLADLAYHALGGLG